MAEGQNVQKVLLESELKINASYLRLLVFNLCVLMLHLTAPKPALDDGNTKGLGGHSESLSVNMPVFEKNRFFRSCSLLALTNVFIHCFSE